MQKVAEQGYKEKLPQTFDEFFAEFEIFLWGILMS
jgi:hypothetical protein